MQIMQVDILYVDDCPNYTRACAVVCDVLAEQGLEATITLTKVSSTNVEDYSLFRGSPTVLIDGLEVETCFSGEVEFFNKIACTLYNCEIHRGCPSHEMIQCAIDTV